MFTHLAKFRTIFVTGPQRSGTTIAGRMIAHDLDREYIDERDYGVHELANLFRLVDETAVIQGPALSAYCHLLPKHVAVVFMHRDIQDIVTSQDRTVLSSGDQWTHAEEPIELRKYFRDAGPIAATKYDVWERFQKPHMDKQGKAYFEVEYATLADHPLWVPKDGRQGWHAKQTSNDQPVRKKKKRI